MTEFQFDFRQMHDWYKQNMNEHNLFDSDVEMKAYIIQKRIKYSKISKKMIKKRNFAKVLDNPKHGYLDAFVKSNITHIAKIKFLKDSKYTNGLYCMMDNNNMYAVYPTDKNGLLVADHFTFMEDNVHQTVYSPYPLNPEYGTFVHLSKCEISTGMTMPLTSYEFKPLKKLAPYDGDVLDIYRSYKVYADGMKRVGLSKSMNRKQGKTSDISILLETLLIKENVEKMLIVCIKHTDKWHVTTITTWDEYSEDSEDQCFRVKNASWNCIQRHLIKYLGAAY